MLPHLSFLNAVPALGCERLLLETPFITSLETDKKVCCRKHEGRAFQVAGCDIQDLEQWGLSQSRHDLALEGI